MASSDNNMNLFLLGHIGNGKSSTANTILGETKFKVCDDLSDDGTLKIESASTQIDGMTVKVVDSPGIQGPNQKEKIEEHLREGFQHCSDGFNALVLVLSYGKRFTEEEEETVEILKEMLGEHFIRDHCIVVFTHGENFMLKAEDLTFESWCQKQTGSLRDLIVGCQGRVVLFCNLTPDKGKNAAKKLIELTLATGKRYSGKIFEQVAKDRREYVKRKTIPESNVLVQQIIEHLTKQETGNALNESIQQLETKISTSKKKMADDIKRGIDEVRRKEYEKALQTFTEVENQFCSTNEAPVANTTCSLISSCIIA